jgi:hypothetical protein
MQHPSIEDAARYLASIPMRSTRWMIATLCLSVTRTKQELVAIGRRQRQLRLN